jgi:flagellar biosynthesis protein FliR
VADSFASLPLLSIGADRPVFDLVIGLFQGCTTLAFRLAGPMFVTMLVVDVALGFLSKTVPQLNVMSVGMSLRSVIGLVVLILGIGLTADVIGDAIGDAMAVVSDGWAGMTPAVPAAVVP